MKPRQITFSNCELETHCVESAAFESHIGADSSAKRGSEWFRDTGNRSAWDDAEFFRMFPGLDDRIKNACLKLRRENK